MEFHLKGLYEDKLLYLFVVLLQKNNNLIFFIDFLSIFHCFYISYTFFHLFIIE
jgi:hypothetical protein